MPRSTQSSDAKAEVATSTALRSTADDGEQSVTLAHGAFIDGQYQAAGETVTVPAADARALVAAGYATPADGEANVAEVLPPATD